MAESLYLHLLRLSEVLNVKFQSISRSSVSQLSSSRTLNIF
jgi:hypothetical protein